MRGWVIDQAAAVGLDLRERRLQIADLARAEEMFLTNAIIGLVSVGSMRLGERHIGFRSRHAAGSLRARLERA